MNQIPCPDSDLTYCLKFESARFNHDAVPTEKWPQYYDEVFDMLRKYEKTAIENEKNEIEKNDTQLRTSEVSIRCDDGAENLVFTRYYWDDCSTLYEINVEDSYCGKRDCVGRSIFTRLKRAWYAFWAKPVYYTGVCIDSTKRVQRFLENCLELTKRG